MTDLRLEIAIFSSSSEIWQICQTSDLLGSSFWRLYSSGERPRWTQYVSSAVKMPLTVLFGIFPGMFGRVLSTLLALVPRVLCIVAIWMTSSFFRVPRNCQVNTFIIQFWGRFHMFHVSFLLNRSSYHDMSMRKYTSTFLNFKSLSQYFYATCLRGTLFTGACVVEKGINLWYDSL